MLKTVHLQQLKGMQSSKGVPIADGKYTKGVPFLPKWYIKGQGLDVGPEPSRIKHCCD